MAKSQNEQIAGETDQQKIDKNLDEKLALPTRARGLNVLINTGRQLDIDPRVLEILEKEKNNA